MKLSGMYCLSMLLVCTLMCVTSVSAQKEIINLAHLEKVITEIKTNEVELILLSKQFGPSHPQILLLKKQIDALHAELAALNPHGALEYSDPARQLRQTMQRFADTMDQLSNQLESIKKLDNELGAGESESGKAFFNASEKMFHAAKTHFAELEALLGEKKPVNDANIEAAQQLKIMKVLLQTQQMAEVQKLQALAAKAAILESQKNTLEIVNQSKSSEQRLDQFDERLSRIEKLLEQLIKQEGSSETSENDR